LKKNFSDVEIIRRQFDVSSEGKITMLYSLATVLNESK